MMCKLSCHPTSVPCLFTSIIKFIIIIFNFMIFIIIIRNATFGSCIKVHGSIKDSKAAGQVIIILIVIFIVIVIVIIIIVIQKLELQATKVTVVGECDNEVMMIMIFFSSFQSYICFHPSIHSFIYLLTSPYHTSLTHPPIPHRPTQSKQDKTTPWTTSGPSPTSGVCG